MAIDPRKTPRFTPLLPWIVVGLLLVAVVGLLVTYVLRPGRTPADEAQTAAAIGAMDAAQAEANERRDAKQSAAALL